jgi:hypothetical protein
MEQPPGTPVVAVVGQASAAWSCSCGESGSGSGGRVVEASYAHIRDAQRRGIRALRVHPTARQVYEFQPVGVDIWDRRANQPEPGTLVVKCSGGAGTPPNGAMGHCYVADADTEAFYGLVLEKSLRPLGASPFSVDLQASNGAVSTFRASALSPEEAGAEVLAHALYAEGYDPADGWQVLSVSPLTPDAAPEKDESSFYEEPEDVSGTVFDPTDTTFGPIIAALQAGEFEDARELLIPSDLRLAPVPGASGRFYEAVENISGTVFDPTDSTFGPIIAALQAGEFEQAGELIGALVGEGQAELGENPSYGSGNPDFDRDFERSGE